MAKEFENNRERDRNPFESPQSIQAMPSNAPKVAGYIAAIVGAATVLLGAEYILQRDDKVYEERVKQEHFQERMDNYRFR